MRNGNVFSAIPHRLRDEIFETLVDSEKVLVQRIISDAHKSPEGFWYDQPEGEFVMLLEGSAALRFEGEDDPHVLEPGDWVDIPAHVKHRVEWTDSEQKTIWLAVFY